MKAPYRRWLYGVSELWPAGSQIAVDGDFGAKNLIPLPSRYCEQLAPAPDSTFVIDTMTDIEQTLHLAVLLATEARNRASSPLP